MSWLTSTWWQLISRFSRACTRAAAPGRFPGTNTFSVLGWMIEDIGNPFGLTVDQSSERHGASRRKKRLMTNIRHTTLRLVLNLGRNNHWQAVPPAASAVPLTPLRRSFGKLLTRLAGRIIEPAGFAADDGRHRIIAADLDV